MLRPDPAHLSRIRVAAHSCIWLVFPVQRQERAASIIAPIDIAGLVPFEACARWGFRRARLSRTLLGTASWERRVFQTRRSQDAVPAQAAPWGEIRRQPSRTDPEPRKNAASVGVKYISPSLDLHPPYQELANNARGSFRRGRTREAVTEACRRYGPFRATPRRARPFHAAGVRLGGCRRVPIRIASIADLAFSRRHYPNSSSIHIRRARPDAA